MEVSKLTIEKLEKLQCMMYRVILNCPKSTPYVALIWDLGGILMKHRITLKKLMFLHHIIKGVDKSSLAFKIQEIQNNLNFPGLIQECKKYIAELELPNIFEEKITHNKWKESVKRAILKQNETDLKSEMKSKTSELLKEEFGMKNYVKEVTLFEARTLFKH